MKGINNSELLGLRVWSPGNRTVLHIGNAIADEQNAVRRKHDEESKEYWGPLGEERIEVTEEKLGLAYVENHTGRAITYKGKLVVSKSPTDNKLHVPMMYEDDIAYVVSKSISFGDYSKDVDFTQTISSIFKDEHKTMLQEEDVFLLTPASLEELADLKFSIVDEPKFYMTAK